ncbi:MAG TPA: CTP synthase, partial [Treponemataceae bacterium]|nr:CTP synthase [Treponemataceae bacterium]
KEGLAQKAYKAPLIWERHRHRYEFNNLYRDQFTKSTMKIAGLNPERNLVEIVELDKTEKHPWMLGVQFHPEFKSRPDRAHPLFRDFIKASLEGKK